MKKIFLPLLLLFFQYLAYAQSCIPGSLILSSQAEVDAFPVNYPGCSVIEGNLAITGSVQNVNALSQITRINETLLLERELFLQDFTGFNNIEYVGGSMYFRQTGAAPANFLPKLDTVMGDIRFEQAISVPPGLKSLKYVGKSILVYYSIPSSGANVFDSLTYVGEDFAMFTTGDSLFGLEKLQFIGRDFFIRHYGDYASFGANLLEVGRNINFYVSGDPVNSGQIHGLNRLKKIGGYYYPFQTDLFGLDSIVSLKGDLLMNRSNRIGGINNLDTLHSNFYLWEGAGSYIPDFPNLKLVKGDIIFEDHSFIGSHLKGYGELDSIRGNLKLINTGIDSITAFANLLYVDSVFISRNNYLNVIDGLDHPLHIQKGMEWSMNPFLFDCSVKAICDKVVTGPAYIYTNGVGCNTIEEVRISCPVPADSDNDSVPDIIDNCVNVYNPAQTDCNDNGIGDLCDIPDNDCDGIANSVDNCIDFPNMYQIDNNNNGIGDACEQFTSLGINTNNPLTELHLSNGTMYIDNPEKSIIFKDFSGLCYMLRIRRGNLVIVEVPCP